MREKETTSHKPHQPPHRQKGGTQSHVCHSGARRGTCTATRGVKTLIIGSRQSCAAASTTPAMRPQTMSRSAVVIACSMSPTAVDPATARGTRMAATVERASSTVPASVSVSAGKAREWGEAVKVGRRARQCEGFGVGVGGGIYVGVGDVMVGVGSGMAKNISSPGVCWYSNAHRALIKCTSGTHRQATRTGW